MYDRTIRGLQLYWCRSASQEVFSTSGDKNRIARPTEQGVPLGVQFLYEVESRVPAYSYKLMAGIRKLAIITYVQHKMII